VVDTNVVLSRITKIRECTAVLRRYSLLDQKAFLRNTDISSSAERQLQVAIQAVIDIGNHVLSDRDLGTPKDYRDIFRILAEHKIVSKALSIRLSAMAGLRNVLVHDYLDVDLKIVYRILKKDLVDFETFIKAVLKLV
jgi:uncharacterized protein YutE (UPF0331/DUF86 family)